MTRDVAEYREALRSYEIHPGGRHVVGGVRPLVSIVISTLNCAPALTKTLDSISQESWPEIEVIIADGGSRDGTLDLIVENAHRITRWMSARDSGIAQGFNRGIAMATGDIIQITNAGDYYAQGHISRVVDLLAASPKAGFVYGDVIMVDSDGQVTRRARGVPDLKNRYLDSMALASHPAMAVRMSTYERVGLFNEDLSMAMDYEWLIRCLKVGIEGVYSDSLVVRMAEGGKSNRLSLHRDWENLGVTLAHRTMPLPLAVCRFGLKTMMNVTRMSLEAVGQDALSYRFRRAVDFVLRR